MKTAERDALLSETKSTAADPLIHGTFEKPSRLHPQRRAWCGARLLLSWATPLVLLGRRKPHLDDTDVWPLHDHAESSVAAERFAAAYRETRSLEGACWRLFRGRFALTGFAFLVSMGCALVGPIVLRAVVTSLGNADFSLERTLVAVAGLFAARVLQAFLECHATFQSQLVAIELIASLKTLLYGKALRLSAASRACKSTAEIASMYTSDSDAIVAAAGVVHQVWLIPLQIALVSVLLYEVLDVAAFACIGMIALLLMVNHCLCIAMLRRQQIYRCSKDRSMKKVTEVFKAIQIIKLNAWEAMFREQIRVVRAQEMDDLFRRRLLVTWSVALLWGMPVFLNLTAFGVYAMVLHRPLTPAVVFSSIALVQLLQSPLHQMTQVFPVLIQARIGVQQLTAFLELEELETANVATAPDPMDNKHLKIGVVIADGAFGWDSTTAVLNDVNLRIQSGEFYAVHGPVGCGKSSLCSALLGEMVTLRGTVSVTGKLAYCSQHPWIQNATIRENILFGLTYDHVKYEHVIDACALRADLASLPAGDATEIGERAVTVSGGQKARIALARACYSGADIFILDSPLAAVDAIVQKEIFHKCFRGLLAHKAIVLVTHDLQIVHGGGVSHSVSFSPSGRVQVEPRNSQVVQATPTDTAVQQEHHSEEVRRAGALAPAAMPLHPLEDGVDGQVVAAEQRSIGRVSTHVFSAYFRAAGGLSVVVLFVTSHFVWQAVEIRSDFWVGAWASDVTTSSSSQERRFEVYAGLGAVSTTMVLVRVIMVTVYGLRAARNLSEWMTDALIHAPMRFFDANPIGRILTRYAGDVSVVDVNLPPKFGRLAQSLLTVVCCTVVAAVVIQSRGLLLVPLAMLYGWIALVYIRPARDLERLVKTTQAPVLTHLSETVDGGAVIRAFGRHHVDRFVQANYAKLDTNSRMRFAQLCVSQWFALRIKLVGSLFVVIVTSSLVMLRDTLGAAIIGLAFSYSLKVAQSLEELVQIVTEIEAAMVSPERIQEFISIPQEPPHRLIECDPPAETWPSKGSIEFVDVCFRYKQTGRLTLHNLNLSIAGGEKLGIVGRTGAGKSSLLMALFRMNELVSGSILIDGVDVSTIGLVTLREKMSIIPQCPILFKGTLRSNLDPSRSFTDYDLWRVLRLAGLRDRIASHERKLERPVEENGENFSVGEHQMLCLAKALLRDARIVIFDEATAAIDHETDHALQQVIRTAFETSTVLTIAHRLDTVFDCDRILVLSSGSITDCAPPATLVDRHEGLFYELMREGGYLAKFQQRQNQPAATNTNRNS